MYSFLLDLATFKVYGLSLMTNHESPGENDPDSLYEEWPHTNLIDANRALSHDALTGLPNRMWLLRILEEGVAARDTPEGEEERGPLGVLYLDIDGFKTVNDVFGHAIGDRVVPVVAYTIASLVRSHDPVFHITTRLHGDEFAIGLNLSPRVEKNEPHAPLPLVLTPQERLDRTIHRLEGEWPELFRQNLTKGLIPDNRRQSQRLSREILGRVPRLGIAIGGALWEHGMTVDDLLHAADQAMSARKERGKNEYWASLPQDRQDAIKFGRALLEYGLGELPRL